MMTVEPPKAKILIVEDEGVIALDIKHRLSKLGYEITGTAETAETAMQLTQTIPPDLVLMDIHLKGEIDGTQVATQIREQFHLPVVFLTAHADDVTLTRAINAHPFGYIIKPFKDNDLSTTIQLALASYRSEIMMQKAIEKEKQLNDLKSQFVSIVSHEFRNPLSTIIVIFELLERQELQLTLEKRQAHLQRGKTVAKEMATLIDDVLVMGEVNRDQFRCDPIPVDLFQFCASLVEDLQISIGSHHRLTLIPHYPETNNPFYALDVKLLQHILTNLLSNGIKYSPPGSEVRLEVTGNADTITFQIHDQGIGIPTQDQIYLFTPFYRCENARHLPGTGLGLSIVKRCVEAHAGVITVSSTVGIGTTFTVTLKSCN